MFVETFCRGCHARAHFEAAVDDVQAIACPNCGAMLNAPGSGTVRPLTDDEIDDLVRARAIRAS